MSSEIRMRYQKYYGSWKIERITDAEVKTEIEVDGVVEVQVGKKKEVIADVFGKEMAKKVLKLARRDDAWKKSFVCRLLRGIRVRL